MPVSVDYVARETASNLWRNRLMTIAAVLTVAVSLTLVGAALLLRQGAAERVGSVGAGHAGHGVDAAERQQTGDPRGGHPAGPAELCAPALRVLGQGTQLRRGQEDPSVRCHRGDDRVRVPDLLLVHAGGPERRQSGHSDVQGDGRGGRGHGAAAADPHRGEGDQRLEVGAARRRRRPDRLGRRADPQLHPHGHLRPPARGVGDEAGRARRTGSSGCPTCPRG